MARPSAARAAARRTAPLLAVLVLAGSLAGCGNGTESYCSSLKQDKARLTRLAAASAKPGTAGTDALGDTVGVLSGLRDEAPDDIADEWDTLVEAMRGLSQAIEDSGADPGDFASGKQPGGVTLGQYKAVQQAAAELQTTRVQQAGASIEQHAQDVCKVDLGTGLGGVG